MRILRTFGFALALIFSTGTIVAGPSAIPLHDTPQQLPAVSFVGQDGNRLTLGQWRGKVVLLNIWATWCVPCREEMPALDRLQALLGNDHFEVVALSIDRAGIGVVREFYDEIGIKNLDIFIDATMQASRDLRIFGLPATLLVGPDGEELGRLIGPAEWDTPGIVNFFEAVIAEHMGKEL